MTERELNEKKKEYLQGYRKLYLKIKSLEEQRLSLVESMRSAKAIEYSDMPKGSKQSDLSDYIVKLDKLISDIDDKNRKLIEKRLDIEKCIMDMSDGIECNLLRKRYIEFKSWEEIS